jgi:DNA repair protein RadC
MSIPGMGMARSSLVTAALEFSRRHYLTLNTRITHPESIYKLLAHMSDRQQECFFTISLNGAHEHIKTRQVSQGLINRTIVHLFYGELLINFYMILIHHYLIWVGAADIPAEVLMW